MRNIDWKPRHRVRAIMLILIKNPAAKHILTMTDEDHFQLGFQVERTSSRWIPVSRVS